MLSLERLALECTPQCGLDLPEAAFEVIRASVTNTLELLNHGGSRWLKPELVEGTAGVEPAPPEPSLVSPISAA
jgi:hypothetical protein